MGTLREVNLELGRPSVDQALRLLHQELRTSKELRYKAVKFIHGYGSSGSGGKIRVAVRRELETMRVKGEILSIIPGERFTIFEAATLAAFSRCGSLRDDEDLERYNNGVTIVLI